MIRNLEEYYPQKLGVRYDPPAIVIEYVLVEERKTMHHKILIPTLQLQSQILASIIRKQHSDYFYKDRITESNIRKLIQKLKKGRNALKAKPATSAMPPKKEVQREQNYEDVLPKKQAPSQKQIQESVEYKQPVQLKKQKQNDNKDKSQVSDNYYGEQFEDFQASQSKSKLEESFQSVKKPIDSPFQFFDQEPQQASSIAKISKPSIPISKPKAAPAALKKIVKEELKNKKKEQEIPKVPQPNLDDCFQFLQ